MSALSIAGDQYSALSFLIQRHASRSLHRVAAKIPNRAPLIRPLPPRAQSRIEIPGSAYYSLRTYSHPMKPSSDPRAMRRTFARELLAGLRVVWPVLSGLLVAFVALGFVAGLFEGWSLQDSIYFAFVSGLTIGYGDLAPKTLAARSLAIVIGFCGVLVTALVAAIAVKALGALGTIGAEDGNDDL
jgi:hypothetical protein